MIAPTAVVHAGARLGRNVRIGHGTIVHANVELGDDVQVDEFCVLGHPTGSARPPLRIGKGSLIRSHSVLYEGSTLGERFESGHHVLVRENTTAGANLRLGGQCMVQGDCTIGDYVRLHSAVQVGKGCTIGDFVWIFPAVTLTNDPLPPSSVEQGSTLEDGVVVCTGSIVMPGTRLGAGVFVAAGSRASGDVPAGKVVDGRNGEVTGDVHRLLSLEHGLRHPWMNHFTRGYPPEALPRIEALKRKLQDLRGK
jgi:UDP-3-O-[3-hydroxymyristoyl] glucosamine N-acyltransferase